MKPLPRSAGRRSVWWAALGVCSLALAVRWWIFAGVHDYPRFELIRNALDDQVTFVEWGQAMARGERYVFDGSRHEFAYWAAARPGVLPQAALYPFLLSLALRADLGFDAVRMAQLVLGALSCGVLVLVAARFTSLVAAALAGLLMALHGPLVFYELTFLRAGLLTPLIVGALWALLGGVPSKRRAFIGGLLLGVAVTLRSSVLPAAVLVAGWALWRELPAWTGESPSGRWRRIVGGPAAALMLGVVLPLAVPLSLNLVRGGALTLSSNGSFNLYLANVHDASGLVASTTPTYDVLKASAPPDQISLFRETLRDVVAHPGAWLRIELRKMSALLSTYEVPNNLSFAMAGRAGPRLRWAIGHWGVLAPLALFGLLVVVSRTYRGRQPEELATLHLLALGSCVVLLLFTVMARQRLVLVPLMALYAALGFDQLADWWRTSRWRALATAPALTGLILWGQVAATRQRPRPVDFQMAAAAAERAGQIAEVQGQVRAARAAYGRAVVFHPPGRAAERLRALGVTSQVDPAEVVEACEAARRRAEQGALPDALRTLRQLAARHPDAATPARYLSNFAVLDADRLLAERWAEEALRRDPLDDLTRRNLGELRRLLAGR